MKELNVKATFSLFLKGKKELGRTWSFDRQGPTESHAAPENLKQFQNYLECIWRSASQLSAANNTPSLQGTDRWFCVTRARQHN